MTEDKKTADKNKLDSERRDKSLYGPLFKERSCLDARYFSAEIKHQQDVNWKISTDKASEAFKVVEEFIEKIGAHGGDTELLLELRTTNGCAAFNASVYGALTQLLQLGTQGTKARWSLRVY